MKTYCATIVRELLIKVPYSTTIGNIQADSPGEAEIEAEFKKEKSHDNG